MAKIFESRFINNICKSIISRSYNSIEHWYEKYSKILVQPQYNIYCNGDLLHVVQMKHLYPDSKRFVDKKLRYAPEQVLKNFATLKRIKPHLPEYALAKFLRINFEEEHSLRQYTPPDWQAEPKTIERIQDRKLKKFALELHGLWRILSRRIYDDCLINANLYSLLYVPKPFIIPGGRFREYYYWDSYWIIRGLVLCEMYESAKNMIENYLYLMETYGIIPNGGRIYYVDRSQPPLLAKMLDTYMEHTNDIEFLKEAVLQVHNEFQFWEFNRSVDVMKDDKQYKMFHYDSFQFIPRPESYREDFKWALALPEKIRGAFFNQVRAAAESGIDFSSRWWVPDWDTKPDFTNIKTSYIIPVDLNCILEESARILAKFFKTLGDDEKSIRYTEKAQKLLDGIENVLWNDPVGCWCDYDYINKISRIKFYPSNLTPLWTKSYNAANSKYVETILEYLKRVDILHTFVGGIPSSLKQTGEQWDLPNAWAPHQDIIVTGLANSNNVEAKQLARVLADRWIRHNYIVFKQHRAMFEKYNSVVVGSVGEGGEYEIQTGFGWTNGVVLDMLMAFPDLRLDIEFYI